VCTEARLTIVGTTVSWGERGLRRYPDQLIESEKNDCPNCKLLRAAIKRMVPEWETAKDEDGNFKCYFLIDSTYSTSHGPEVIVQAKGKVICTFMLFSPEGKALELIYVNV
jgi:hypothetical protein